VLSRKQAARIARQRVCLKQEVPPTHARQRFWRNDTGDLPHRVMRRLPFFDEQKKTRLRSHLSA
jgi:hypothetical protein